MSPDYEDRLLSEALDNALSQPPRILDDTPDVRPRPPAPRRAAEPKPVRRTAERSRASHRLGRAMAPAILYAGLTLLMLWPLPLMFDTHVPFGGDAMQYIWNLWWFRQAAEQGSSPLWTNQLYHPYGVSTLFSTLVPLASLASVPAQWLGLPIVAAYNLLLIASTVLGAWAMWALVRRLTGSWLAALVAGLIYGWAPFHSAHMMGHLNLASYQWLPLGMLALTRTADALLPSDTRHAEGEDDDGSPWLWGGLTGLVAAVTVYTELTFAILLGLWGLLYVAYRVVGALRAGALVAVVQLLGPLTVAVVVAATLAIPLLVPMARELRAASYMIPDPGETLQYSADPAFYLLPSELHPLWGADVARLAERHIGGTPAERIITPGLTALLLAGVGLVVARGRPAARFWGLSTLVFATLSLGPILRVLGQVHWTVFRAEILLPYALLYRLPGFSVMRTPSRFAVLVPIGCAVLAGMAIAAALRARPRQGQALAVLAAVGVLAEGWIAPPLVPLDPYPPSEIMRADAAPGAVLDLPQRQLVDYLWYQTQHGRPIVGGHLSRQPPDRFAQQNPAVVYLDPTTPVTASAAIDGGAGLRSLAHARVRYLTIHWWAADANQADLARKVQRLVGNLQPIAEYTDRITVYRLPEPVEP